MSSSRGQRVPVTTLLREELNLIESVLCARIRRRIYRHHLFFREAIALRYSLRQALPRLAQRDIKVRKIASKLLAITIRCAESAVLELSASRVDTISLATFILAISSRIGCILGVLRFKTQNDIFTGLNVENEKFLVAHSNRRQKRGRSTIDNMTLTPLRHPTIGTALDTTVPKVTSEYPLP